MYVKNLNEWITSYETNKVSETETYDYLELNDNRMVIAVNIASWSWDDSGGQNTLHVILDTDTGNLHLKVRKYNRYDLGQKTHDTISIRGRFGTLSKPNLSGINKVMQEYNFDQRFGQKMKRNTWNSVIVNKWDSKLIDILKSPELQNILNMGLIENSNIENSNTGDDVYEGIEWDNSKYFNSHGKNPKGDGSWFLEVQGYDKNNRYKSEEFQLRGSLTQVKKQVKEDAKQSGFKTITKVVILP